MAEAALDPLTELQRQVARLEEEAQRSADLQRQAEKQRAARAAHVEERLGALDDQSRELRGRLRELEAQASAAPPSGDARAPEDEARLDAPQFASVETEQRAARLEQQVAELFAKVGQLGAPADDGRLQELDQQLQALSTRVAAPPPPPEPLAALEALAAEVRSLRGPAVEAASRAAAAAEEAAARTGEVERRIAAMERGPQAPHEPGDSAAEASTAAHNAAAEMREAVAAAQGRVAQLEEQLQAEGAAGAAPGFAQQEAERLGRLEGALEELKRDVQGRVQQLEEGAWRVLGRVAQLEEDLRAAPAAAAEAPPGAADAALGEGLRRLECAVEALTPLNTKSEAMDRALQDLQKDVRELHDRDLEKVVASVTQDLVADLDKKSESRLTMVWQELSSHAGAAAARAEQVEQGIVQRMEALEFGLAEHGKTLAEQAKRRLPPESPTQKVPPPSHPGCNKLIDSLTWRVSWLEWSIAGDKRSFSRPIDVKATMPWSQSELVHAPPTEDSELLARDASGQLRPRRKVNMKALMGSGEGPAGAAEARGAAAQLLRGSKSQGRLLPLRPAEP